MFDREPVPILTGGKESCHKEREGKLLRPRRNHARPLQLIFLVLTLTLNFSFAKTIDVGKDFPFRSLKDAMASADSGDVIYVHGGTYKEGNILIHKSITLCGIGKPVIDGDNKDEVITITASHVILDGFVIQHSGKSDLKEIAGIHLISVHDVLISDNELRYNYFSLVIDGSFSCVIFDNRIMSDAVTEASSGNGIHCWKSSNLTIASNTISGQRDGIYFEFVANSYVNDNLSKNNLRYGIHFMFSDNDTYVNNIFRSNGSGVAVMYSRHVNMYHNTFEKSWGGAAYGLLLKELSDSKIISNKFSENTTGIFLEGTSRSRFERNGIYANGWAFKILGDCYSDTILENNFSGNTFDVSTNAGENENLFANNYWDKYRGYDLNRDGRGDVPFHPVSLYSKLVETVPNSVLLLHSFFVNVLDETEKILPSITPEQFRDDSPTMKPYDLAAN